MTEQEWLTTNDLHMMLAYLEGKLYHWHRPDTAPNATDRQMRLYACACCRRIWENLDSDCHHSVEMAEHFADGLVDEELLLCWRQWAVDRLNTVQSPLASVDLQCLDWDSASESEDRYLRQCGLDPVQARTLYAASWPIQAVVEACSKVWPRIMTDGREWGTTHVGHAVAKTLTGVFPSQAQEVREWSESVQRQSEEHLRLLRHIIGNPFHPYPAPDHWSSTVVHLAEALYNGQDCGFALHDAVLDAGHAELADHFRQEQWHPKGCWGLDAILGKT